MEKLNKFTKFFRKIYYQIFVENFKGKLNYNFPHNYHRWDLIEYLIKKNNYSDYLEIGCDQDQLFSKIKINNKKGVDPVSGGNIRKTSDDFFKVNDEMFDIVFIDGLHTYDQVKKDILNSVDCLKENGIIYGFVPYLYKYHAPMDLKYQDYFRFSKDTLAYLFKDFNDVELFPLRGRLSSALHMLVGNIWKKYIEKTKLNFFLDNFISEQINFKQCSGFYFIVKK